MRGNFANKTGSFAEQSHLADLLCSGAARGGAQSREEPLLAEGGTVSAFDYEYLNSLSCLPGSPSSRECEWNEINFQLIPSRKYLDAIQRVSRGFLPDRDGCYASSLQLDRIGAQNGLETVLGLRQKQTDSRLQQHQTQ